MATWTNTTKSGGEESLLLKEDSDYLLLETGDYIILIAATTWANDLKNSATWTNQSKN